MDWLSALRVVAPLAPSVLNIVGSFIPIPGAGLMLQALGTGIANALGVPATPEAVAQAARNASDIEIARINAAVEEQKARWAAGTEIEKAWARVMEAGAEQVNLTMRAELLATQHFYFTGWRSGAGWTFTIHAFLFGFVLLYAALYDAILLDRLTAAWPIYAAFFGTLAAMVGVYIVGRTQERIAGVIPPPPSKVASKPK